MLRDYGAVAASKQGGREDIDLYWTEVFHVGGRVIDGDAYPVECGCG